MARNTAIKMSAIIKNLKKYKWHFYAKKNDRLYTELNFARIWSNRADLTPVFSPQIYEEQEFPGEVVGKLSTVEYQENSLKI